jgi:hypothetical protein
VFYFHPIQKFCLDGRRKFASSIQEESNMNNSMLQGAPTTLGELMGSQRRDAIRASAMFMAIVLYVAVLVYTGVHNFNLMSRTVAPDQQLFAMTALLCLEGASIFLPLAIHFWLAPGPQRMVGYVLYGANFFIVILNTILDAITNRSQSAPEWLTMYATFILPAAPVLIGVGIAFIFLLDPSKKIYDARASAQAASVDAMAIQMREAANRPDVNEAIQIAAIKDMQEAAVRVTGVRIPQITEPKARVARRSSQLVLNADGTPAPKLAKRAKKSKTTRLII